MNYKASLFLRLLSAIIIGIFYNLFYMIIGPVTFYASYIMLNIIYSVKISANALIINEKIINFIPACYAILAYFLLAMLILFTKDIGFWKGVKMFVLGSVMLFFVNLLRIFILVMILLEKGTNYFSNIHLVTWKIGSTLFVAVLWIFLARQFKVKEIPVYSDIVTLVKKIKN